MSSAPERTGKVILLGKSAVGKTALVWRIIHDTFNSSTQSTIGAAFALKIHKGVKLGIWDTAGQEKYDALSGIYCRNAHVALLCWDMTDVMSFERLPKYVEKLRSVEQDASILMIGTKEDLVQEQGCEPAVSTERIQEYAKEIGAHIFCTSAKSGKLDGLLDFIADSLKEQEFMKPQPVYEDKPSSSKNDGTVQLTDVYPSSTETKEGGCCK